MLVYIATWTNYCLVHVVEEVEHDHMHSNVGVPLNIKVLNYNERRGHDKNKKLVIHCM